MHHPQNPTHQHQDIRALCTHTFNPRGSEPARRCGSPALRGETFCYYHHPSRKPAGNPHQRRSRRFERKSVRIPLPVSRAEFHHCLIYLMHLIATNEIDTRRAGLLLNALQTAGKNLPD
jgi:hypothetical protein